MSNISINDKKVVNNSDIHIYISIVLPTYNGEKWLAESIKSVINQTEKRWELIIVNDCSTDNTLKIAEEFAKKDSRISVITNEVNKKLPASLNIGFSKASGKYLTWTSDDNLYKPDALEKMLKYLESHSEADMVSMNMDYINEEGRKLRGYRDFFYYKTCAAELIDACNVGGAFLYRKTIADKVGKYDENMFCAEDYDYWCRIALAGNIEYTEDNVYQYRINQYSLTATKKSQISEKTGNIKKKYADDFFKKFNFTDKDKKIFYIFSLKNSEFIKRHTLYYMFSKFYIFFTKIAVLPIFWNSELRKKTRRLLVAKVKKYSFNKKK